MNVCSWEDFVCQMESSEKCANAVGNETVQKRKCSIASSVALKTYILSQNRKTMSWNGAWMKVLVVTTGKNYAGAMCFIAKPFPAKNTKQEQKQKKNWSEKLKAN